MNPDDTQRLEEIRKMVNRAAAHDSPYVTVSRNDLSSLLSIIDRLLSEQKEMEKKEQEVVLEMDAARVNAVDKVAKANAQRHADELFRCKSVAYSMGAGDALREYTKLDEEDIEVWRELNNPYPL